MGLTNFPNGITSFGMPVLGSGEETITTGNVFFVDSGASNAADGNAATDPSAPAATIDGAIGKCTANNGDIIFVMPGHSESVGAGDIAMDVAGVWVRGLGWGADRPTITMSATGSTVAMSAASTRISNLRFLAGAASIFSCITVTAADVRIENIETVLHATSEFLIHINADASASRMLVRGCRLANLAAASGNSGIYLDGCDDIEIIGNIITGHFAAAACIDNTTGSDEALRANIIGNYLKNDSTTAGDLAVSMDDAASGIFALNMLSGGLATTAANYEIGNMSSLESYIVDDAGVDVHGIVLGTAAV